jgi:hypothetical protein
MVELLDAGQPLDQYLAKCRYREAPATPSDDIDEIFAHMPKALGPGLVSRYTTRATRVGPSRFVSRTGRVIVCSAAEFARRNNLPYGRWTCADGRVVWFNRFYEPIYQRRPGEALTEADASEWVSFVKQEWAYGDGAGYGEPEKRRKAKAALTEAMAQDAAAT